MATKTIVQIGSWNVNGDSSTQLDLTEWLEKALSPSPDFILCGFQELSTQPKIAVTIPSQQSLWINQERLGSSKIVFLDIWIDAYFDMVFDFSRVDW
jgi:hypothetical protein